MAKTALKEKSENTNKVKGMFIERIQIKEGRGIITYKNDSDTSLNAGTHTGRDECTEEFKTLFQKTKEIFTEIIPILKKDIDNIKMNAITFYYDKTGFLEKVLFSVVYSFTKQGNVINLSTPQIPIYKDNMSETTVAVSGQHVEQLHEVIAKAKAYINGETRTKQMTLIVDNTQN